jgi:hypothetical protein
MQLTAGVGAAPGEKANVKRMRFGREHERHGYSNDQSTNYPAD